MLQRYLIVWLTLLSLVAFFWPAETLADPFTTEGLPWLFPTLIVVSMFCIGLMLPQEEVRQVARRWPTVFGGTFVQYASMPLLAFLAATIFGLQGDLFTGVVMVGCVPGAMASNILTLNARGNASYSVSLTTTATLISPIAVPLALGIALGAWDWTQVRKLIDGGIFLSWSVVLPTIVGHLTSRYFPKREALFRRIAPITANLAILWIIAVVVGSKRETLGAAGSQIIVALLVINVGGYTAGWLGARAMQLNEPMSRALTLEVGMQNAGLGTALAAQLFPNQTDIVIAPALYTFGCMLTGTMLAWVWSRAKES